MIDRQTVDEIILSAKIEEVIEEFVHLKRRGSVLSGLCPFHDEKTPSFTVSPAKGIYKCFGCGKGGDAVRFIMDLQSLSYPEALRFLAAKYNIQIQEKELSTEQLQEKQLADSLYIVNEFAAKFFRDELLDTEKGRAIGLGYFRERGFNQATIDKFMLGYAPDDRDALSRKALEKSFNKEHLQLLGLTTKNAEIDFFRSRVMFTLHNVNGKINGFAGRLLTNDKTQPKYINSIESEIYNKRKNLYALHLAKTFIRKYDECLLVEGYTDVISLHQAGIENVVASSGTSLTEEQVRLIRKFTDNIKIIYDGDPAGIKAALRGLDIVLAEGLNVKLVLLPDGDDPDSYLKKVGADAFKNFIENEAQDFVFFKTKMLVSETKNDPIQKSIAIKDIVSSIAKIPDLLKQSLYISECSKLLQISENLLASELTSALDKIQKEKFLENQRKKHQEQKDATAPHYEVGQTEDGLPSLQLRKVSIGDEAQEYALIHVLINYGDHIYDHELEATVADFIWVNIEEFIDMFDNPIYQAMFKILGDFQANEQGFDPKFFVHHENQEFQEIAVRCLHDPYIYANWESKGILLQTQKLPEENYIRECTDALNRFRYKKVCRVVHDFSQTIKSAEFLSKSIEEQEVQLKVYQRMLEERNSLNQILNRVVV